MALQGRTALVTGASRGIGLEVARGLAKAGARVVLVAHDEARLEAARAGLAGAGLDVVARAADLTGAEAIDRLVASLDGRLDVLINNAGVIDEPVPTWEEPVEAFDRVLATNLRAPFLLCRAVVPLMLAGGWGRIVNVSSGMGAFSDGLNGGHPAYRISKAGLNAMSRNLAAELAGKPILVNAMCPGWVKTDMGGEGAPRSVEQGADTAIYLATLPAGGPSGQFWRDRQVIPW